MKKKKVELERNIAQLKAGLIKDGKRLEALKASQVVEINNLNAKARANLEKVVAEHYRRHLISKGYSEDEVGAIRADTYAEEEEDEEVELVDVGVLNGLDGISLQMVRDNQGDGNDRPEGENEKVELKSARLHEDEARQCNQEFVEEFDRMREATKDREDQHARTTIYANFNPMKNSKGRSKHGHSRSADVPMTDQSNDEHKEDDDDDENKFEMYSVKDTEEMGY
ncbi:hypothetical protein GIB67_013915 [Kingdonia uniflora]|uniref:Uncharacterized protein n=1 Tax=Kingdonia uniflora TaxID=39325 RepID=A0A7J7LDK1_9MAGN|nr:hypothetical protein GIB67_013915 [Kingdonia uniflora]